MYRYCLVHFERNLCCVANISIAVDRNMREEFKDMARNLINIPTFNDFACEVKSILKQFPLLAIWFKWYLNMKRAPFMYTCLRNLSPAQEKIIEQLKKDTLSDIRNSG